MKRRTFLMMAGGLAGGLVVTGCSSDAGTPVAVNNPDSPFAPIARRLLAKLQAPAPEAPRIVVTEFARAR